MAKKPRQHSSNVLLWKYLSEKGKDFKEWSIEELEDLGDVLGGFLLVSFGFLLVALLLSYVAQGFLVVLAFLYFGCIIWFLVNPKAFQAAAILVVLDFIIDFLTKDRGIEMEDGKFKVDLERTKEFESVKWLAGTLLWMIIYNMLAMLFLSIADIWSYPPSLAMYWVLLGLIWILMSTPWAATMPGRFVRGVVGASFAVITVMYLLKPATDYIIQPALVKGTQTYNVFSDYDPRFILVGCAAVFVFFTFVGKTDKKDAKKDGDKKGDKK